MNSISLLTSLRRPRARRSRRQPESAARSGRARDLPRLTRPLCDCAIHAYYVLARPRTTSADAPRNPGMLAPSQQKAQKNQNKSRKTKEKPFGPWPSLPSAVFYTRVITKVTKVQSKTLFTTFDHSNQNHHHPPPRIVIRRGYPWADQFGSLRPRTDLSNTLLSSE